MEEGWCYLRCVPSIQDLHRWLPLSMCGMNKQVISVTRGFSQSLSPEPPGKIPRSAPGVSSCDS